MCDRSHIFENMVVVEAVKKLSHKAVPSELYMLSNVEGIEVDLVIGLGEKWLVYEIKFAKTVNTSMTTNLKKIMREYPHVQGELLTMNPMAQPISCTIRARPRHQILSCFER